MLNSQIPLILLGVGALWYLTKEDDEYSDDEYADDDDLSFAADFDPSEYAFDEGEFSGARGRDRKLRAAARKMARYEKCVAKKGESHKRCQKILSRAEKKLLKSAALEEKLVAKGKITQVGFDSSGNIQTAIGAGNRLNATFRPGGVSRGGSGGQDPMAEGDAYTSDLYAEDITGDMAPASDAGVNPVVLAFGGLAVLGVVGFGIYSIAKKP